MTERIDHTGALAREDFQDTSRAAWAHALWADLQFAVRGLRHDLAFTVATIAMVSIAVGLNATLSVITNAMLFSGLPNVQNSDRLVFLQERFPSGLCCISYRDFLDWRSQANSFEGMAYVASETAVVRIGKNSPVEMEMPLVSANAFTILGREPFLGRDFLPSDEVQGAPAVVILNFRFWARQFDERADAVGSTIDVNGTPATIVGVMPEGFEFPHKYNLWMPVVQTPALRQGGISPAGYQVVARLKEGVSVESARAEMETISRRLETAYPTTNQQVTATVVTHAEGNVGQNAQAMFTAIWVGGWFVLLIACVNVGNASMIRTIARWRELGTRIALGLTHVRVLRQLAVEGLLIAIAAAVLGVGIMVLGVRVWAVMTASPYQILDYSIHGGAGLYVLAVALAAAVLNSLAPLITAAQYFARGKMGHERGGPRVTKGGRYLSSVLIVGQTALAVTLVCGTGVLARSFYKIVRADTGITDPEQVIVGAVRLPAERNTRDKMLEYFDRLDTQLNSTGGIQRAAIVNTLPVKVAPSLAFEIDGRPGPPQGEQFQIVTVGSGYFDVLGARILSGRDFDPRDNATAPRAVIVNERFAELHLGGQQAIGQRIRLKNRPNAPWWTVVGVVSNVMQATGGDTTRQQFRPLIYAYFRQFVAPRQFVVARTDAVAAAGMIPTVRDATQDIDPDAMLGEFTTLAADMAFQRDTMDAEHSELGNYLLIAPILTAVAVLLAAIGLSTVVANAVTQRTREMGIRIALGATPTRLRHALIVEGMLPVVIGAALGMGASLAVNNALRSQLVGVAAYDLPTMIGGPALLLAIALCACYIPAQLVMRADPSVVLRQD